MDWKDALVTLLFPSDIRDAHVEEGIALKYQHIPARLFKFYRCDQNGIQNLSQNQVWLSFPSRLNDPYDCSLTFSMGTITNEFFRTHIDGILDSIGPNYKVSDEQRAMLSKSDNVTRDLARVLVPQDPSICAGIARDSCKCDVRGRLA